MTNEVVANHYSIELSRATFDWSLDQGRLRFLGAPAALFQLGPSLMRAWQSLAEELGIPLFRLLIAHSASEGAGKDYWEAVASQEGTFEEAFAIRSDAMSAAGWGRFELALFDPEQHRAIVRVHNPWELEMQRGQQTSWGCPYLQGTIAGLFSHIFGVACRAEEAKLIPDGDETFLELQVYRSERTFADELAALREVQAYERQKRMIDELAARTLELEQANEERLRLQEQVITMQAQILAEVSTPLIPLNDKVLLMPLVGAFDSQRTQLTVERLLHGVAERRATVVILDITGVPIVDTHVASALMQAAQAVRLLGAQVVLTGIRPEVAQTLVGMGVSLQGIASRGTLQSGIEYANSIQ
ncbi:MAG: STAS domain-containing protein [Chloroflexi bacterium]|nr:STAS domain-containing protein [Chloroflexota bacterium]